MPLRYTAQFPKAAGIPSSGRHVATASLPPFVERPAHLGNRRGFVGKELQPLLADDHVELLLSVQRKRVGAALAPDDIGRHRPCDGEHVWADVDADDLVGVD